MEASRSFPQPAANAATAGGGGISGGGGDFSGDWRAKLPPEARQRNIISLLHALVSSGEGLNELEKMVVQFEEKMYTAAINQSDYLRKISLKYRSMMTKTCSTVAANPSLSNPTFGNQRPSESANVTDLIDFTSQNLHADTGDWQEELYQKVKSMKELYYTEITEIHQNITSKIQQLPHNEAPGLPAKQSDQFYQIKQFKQMLERMIMLLETSKSNIQANLKEKLPIYEKEIIRLVAANRRKNIALSQQQGQPQYQHLSRHADTADWQEEIYQKVKSMKELYYAEITELHEKISSKIQQFPREALGPPAKQEDQFDKLKQLKQMLERAIMLLQTSKSNIQANLKERLPIYEKQIECLLASNRCTKMALPQKQQPQFQHLSGHVHSMSGRHTSQTSQLQQDINQLKQSQVLNLQSSVTPLQEFSSSKQGIKRVRATEAACWNNSNN